MRGSPYPDPCHRSTIPGFANNEPIRQQGLGRGQVTQRRMSRLCSLGCCLQAVSWRCNCLEVPEQQEPWLWRAVGFVFFLSGLTKASIRNKCWLLG